MSCLITLHNTFVMYLPLPLIKQTYVSLPHFHNDRSTHLLFTYPNHLNLTYLILFTAKVSLILSQISSFIFLSLLVCPNIHLNIIISTTFRCVI
uniref:Putative ovule protein n=1 Tax=Solanum chacoense TaxID=4108 RepID=A0A0V0IPI0_SOLCH